MPAYMDATTIEALEQEVADLASKGAIVPVPNRPVINLKSLNKHSGTTSRWNQLGL